MATVRDIALLLVGSLVVVGIILVSGPIAGALARYASDTLGISIAAMVLGLILAIPLAAVAAAWHSVQEDDSFRQVLERGSRWHRGNADAGSLRKVA